MPWDYRDRHGAYWRYDEANSTWSRYDGAQWVVSAGPPPRWAARFNPLTAGGRKANSRLWAITVIVCGFVLLAASIPLGLGATAVAGSVMMLLGVGLGVRSWARTRSGL